MQKKILLLGGSHGQLPAIEEAKKRGLYTILIDYLPDNPGRALVDKYYEVSTTDKEAVLEIAIKYQVDAVLAYASDPAAATQAFVSKKLDLIGNTEKSVYILSNKNAFRKFQQENNFNVPAFQTFSKEQFSELDGLHLDFPVVVKPVDASDSKGVYKVDSIDKLREKAKIALSFSKIKKVIIEEFIVAGKGNLHGDAFFMNGEMIFCMLGDRQYSSVSNPLKPAAELYPGRLPKSLLSRVENEVESIVSECGFKHGPINIEARVDGEGKIYVMEIGPRNGGLLTPQAIYYCCGANMVQATFDIFLNNSVILSGKQILPTVCYALHSNRFGIFDSFELHKKLLPFVKEIQIYAQPGDKVEPFSEAGSTIGVLILTFPDFSVAEKYLDTLYNDVQASLRLKSEGTAFDE